jgi:hypothetical protein
VPKYGAAPQRRNTRARADNENRTEGGQGKQIGPFEAIMRQSKDNVELIAASRREAKGERRHLQGLGGRRVVAAGAQ